MNHVNELPYLDQITLNHKKVTADIERWQYFCSLICFCNIDTKIQLYRSFCYNIILFGQNKHGQHPKTGSNPEIYF